MRVILVLLMVLVGLIVFADVSLLTGIRHDSRVLHAFVADRMNPSESTQRELAEAEAAAGRRIIIEQTVVGVIVLGLCTSIVLIAKRLRARTI